MPTAVSRNVPSIGSKKPPEELWLGDPTGDCTSRLGFK
jgi:hypothetical protein